MPQPRISAGLVGKEKTVPKDATGSLWAFLKGRKRKDLGRQKKWLCWGSQKGRGKPGSVFTRPTSYQRLLFWPHPRHWLVKVRAALPKKDFRGKTKGPQCRTQACPQNLRLGFRGSRKIGVVLLLYGLRATKIRFDQKRVKKRPVFCYFSSGWVENPKEEKPIK